MSIRTAATAVLLMSAALSAAAPAPAPKPEPPPAEPAKPAGPASPEEAVARLDAAIAGIRKDGKVEPVLAVFDDGIAKTLDSLFTLSEGIGAAQKRLSETMDKKFGKDPAAKTRLPNFAAYRQTFREGLEEVLRLKVSSTEKQADDRVLITVQADVKSRSAEAPGTRDDKYVAVRQADGVWKLTPEKLAGDPRTMELFQMQVEAFRRTPEALDKVAVEVEKGVYKTRDEADRAAFAAFLSVIEKLQSRAEEK